MVTQGPTYAHRVLDAFSRFAGQVALRYVSSGAWVDLTYAELGDRVLDCAAALTRRGIVHGDRIAIWLETSWPWVVMDLAVQLVGGVTTTVYPTLPPGQAAGIIRDCQAKALLTTSDRLVGLAGEAVLGTPVELVILAGDAPTGGVPVASLLAEGHAARAGSPELRRVLAEPRITPSDLSAIVYTSGTTGEPKGAMLTHANVLSNAEGAAACFSGGRTHTLLLHLPLAHTMGRNTVLGTLLLTGGITALAEPEREKLPKNLVETAPTLFVTVPSSTSSWRASARCSPRRVPLAAPSPRGRSRSAVAAGSARSRRRAAPCGPSRSVSSSRSSTAWCSVGSGPGSAGASSASS
jgi:long-chain acyl-CoA synthetase